MDSSMHVYHHLSQKKKKRWNDVVGNLIKAKTAKSRLSKENKDVSVRLYYYDESVVLTAMVFLNSVRLVVLEERCRSI